MSAERDAVVAALVAERYGRPRWWNTRPAAEATDDELTTAARRRAMADDFDKLDAPRELGRGRAG